MADGLSIFLRKPKPNKDRAWKIEMGIEMELRLAAQWAGYTFEQFQALPGASWWSDSGESKASVLVSYRAYTLMNALSYETR